MPVGPTFISNYRKKCLVAGLYCRTVRKLITPQYGIDEERYLAEKYKTAYPSHSLTKEQTKISNVKSNLLDGQRL